MGKNIFFCQKKIIIKPSDCHKLRSLPLGYEGLFEEIELYYIEVPVGCSSVKIDVHDYI